MTDGAFELRSQQRIYDNKQTTTIWIGVGIMELLFTIAIFFLTSNTANANSTPVEPLTVEEKIIKELGPEFIAIAKCESGIRQFNKDGTVLISDTSDVGLFQINQVHWDTAKAMGIDINTVDGNIAYAKFLKEQNGYGDWYMSFHCHGYKNKL